MRWFWTLVFAGLVAVASVRPPAPRAHARDHQSTLTVAHHASPVLARRDRDRLPELQLPVALLPVVGAPAAPPISVILAAASPALAPVSVLHTSRSARGPPVG